MRAQDAAASLFYNLQQPAVTGAGGRGCHHHRRCRSGVASQSGVPLTQTRRQLGAVHSVTVLHSGAGQSRSVSRGVAGASVTDRPPQAPSQRTEPRTHHRWTAPDEASLLGVPLRRCRTADGADIGGLSAEKCHQQVTATCRREGLVLSFTSPKIF